MKPELPFSLDGESAERPQLGEYQLVSKLATGGMSEVWLADAPRGQVIIKRLLPELRGHKESIARFEAEAALGIRLAHEHVARCFGLLRHGNDLFLAQELVGGESLAMLAAAARKSGERLPPSAVVHAMLGLLSALQHLHEHSLVHADVNPDNLVARPDGVVKLIDLGLAHAPGESTDGALRGTPSYMSPEQVKSRPLDARSDLFSAAIAFWELLANRPLFAAESEFETLRRVLEMAAPPLRQVFPEAPTALERLLVVALAKDPSQRFQTAAQLAAEIRSVAARSGLENGQKSLSSAVERWAPRSPRA